MPDQPVELNAATELFNRSPQKAIARQLPIADLFNGAATLQSMQQRPLAAELYKTWIAYNGDNEVLHAVYFNYGVALNDIARPHRRHQRLPRKHPAEAGFRSALHQSWPRARGHRADRRGGRANG